MEWSAPAECLCSPCLHVQGGGEAPPGAVSPQGGPACPLHHCPHEHTWGYPLTGLSRHRGLELLGAMHWAWVTAAVAFGLQLLLLGGAGARREPKSPQQPSQHTEPPTATTFHSEELMGSPKVRSGWLHVGRVARTCRLRAAPWLWQATFSLALPCLVLWASLACLGGVGLWAGLAAAALRAATGAPGPGEGWGRGGAVLDPLKPQVPHASSSLLRSGAGGAPLLGIRVTHNLGAWRGED